MSAPKIPSDQIAEKIGQLSRQPFQDQVARFLVAAPSHQAIVALGERSPDRWGQAIAILARLAGYTDKLEVEATLHARVSAMSDAELQAAIAEQSLMNQKHTAD